MKINFITFGDKDGKRGSTRIRVLNLMAALEKKGWTCAFNDENIEGYDLLFFQKTTLRVKVKEIIKQARLRKIPIILDLDDYSKLVLSPLKYFDMITVSTPYLKALCDPYHPNVVVIPNMLDMQNIDFPLKTDNRHKNVVWYGYSQNSYILEKWNIEGVKRISDKKGDIPYKADKIDEQLQQFDMVVIPQEQNEKTLVKTHCRMLKALYLGLPCMVSDMPVYIELAKQLNFPENFIVSNPDEWNQKIKDFKAGKLKFNFNFEKAREIIIQNYGAEAIVNIFQRTIEKFMQEKHTPLAVVRDEKLPISVIMSADDDKKLIKSLESLLNQTLFDIEIILTGKKLSTKLTDYMKKDKRIYFNKIPEGKYIYFLNSGDWIEPDCLKHLYAAMEISKADVVMMDDYIINNSVKNLVTANLCGKLITDMGEMAEFLDYPLSFENCIYRKNFLTENGIMLPDYASFPDTEFLYRVYKNCRSLYVIPKAFLHCTHDNISLEKDMNTLQPLLKNYLNTKIAISAQDCTDSIILIIRDKEQIIPAFITLQSIIKNLRNTTAIKIYSIIKVPESIKFQLTNYPNVYLYELPSYNGYKSNLNILFNVLLSQTNANKILYISNSCLALSNLDEIFELDNEKIFSARKMANDMYIDTNVLLINVQKFKDNFENYPPIKKEITNAVWYSMMYFDTEDMPINYNYLISEFANITPYLLSEIKLVCYENKLPWKNLSVPFGFLWWQYARKNTFYENVLFQLTTPRNNNNLNMAEKIDFLKHVNQNQDKVYSLMVSYIKETFLWLITFGNTAAEHKAKLMKISKSIQDEVMK